METVSNYDTHAMSVHCHTYTELTCVRNSLRYISRSTFVISLVLNWAKT